jgi:hypothetical protein
MTWFGVGEFSFVFLIFLACGACFGLCFPDPTSGGVALTFGGSAGIAGSIAWALLCSHQRWRSHANWILAGMLAGVLGHPVFALLTYCVWRDTPFLAVPLVTLFGLLFWGIITVPVGFVAAAVCRVVLAKLSPVQLRRPEGR